MDADVHLPRIHSVASKEKSDGNEVCAVLTKLLCGGGCFDQFCFVLSDFNKGHSTNNPLKTNQR